MPDIASHSLSRRAFLRTVAAVPVATTITAAVPEATAAATVAYAGIRIAKHAPTTATTPDIELPDGYTLVRGSDKSFASPWQYYAYIQGPPAASVEVTVRWAGEDVDAIMSKGVRVPFRPVPEEPGAVRVTLPVTDTIVDPANLRIRSALSDSAALFYQVEHNHPGRAAGVWAVGAWPAGEVAAVINYLIGANRVLHDSGLLAAAQNRGHTFYLTGFETYTTLHPDDPPHWHLGYYPGPKDAPGSYMPHLLLDGTGRITANGMDVDGAGRTTYHTGEPAQIKDKEGLVVVTLTIRADGGLDIAPPTGPVYSLAPSSGGTAIDGIDVRKAGAPWLAIRTKDDHLAGALTVCTDRGDTTVYRYDRHTGGLE
jgi:hypothetical protein